LVTKTNSLASGFGEAMAKGFLGLACALTIDGARLLHEARHFETALPLTPISQQKFLRAG
jgi:hypothetical protein